MPLIGGLTPTEQKVVELLRDRAKVLRENATDAPLFAQLPGESDRIDTTVVVRRLQFALRKVIGDLEIRYYHLRHSWATRVFVALLSEQAGASVWNKIVDRLSFPGRASQGSDG